MKLVINSSYIHTFYDDLRLQFMSSSDNIMLSYLNLFKTGGVILFLQDISLRKSNRKITDHTLIKLGRCLTKTSRKLGAGRFGTDG